MSYEFKVWIIHMMQQVIFSSSKHIINNNHIVTSLNQSIHQMAPYKTSSTSYHYPLPFPSYTTRYTCHYACVRRRFF
ncbi:hypothetical protein Lalb_Chr15g0083451 [Lupinus albus]|uniref:Uncharacterized protein n=1 Tax=Lupinus albus TaxID=3870 RepID=A0A6A4PDF0_LUPAL|nr:hypothetical protein Lalb_Chr15g0083451 [Lupinus albus]